MATVSLRELGEHLTDAKKIVDRAFASDEEEPAISFEDLRRSLRAALKMLGGDEQIDHREDFAPGSADSRYGYRGQSSPRLSKSERLELMDFSALFPKLHPQRAEV